MADRQRTRTVIQVVLGIIIVALAYVLYLSITGPYEEIERRQALTDLTHARMDDIRVALINYERQTDRFPGTLDSLDTYIDTTLLANPDSVFGEGFVFDSLFYSPRTGEMFEYAVNDTSRFDIYLLEDPATGSTIGSLEPDPTMVNVASWE